MKMALIGGGGVRTVFFCQSLAKYAQQLDITELRLMDNDSEKLYIYGQLAQYAVSQTSNLKITLYEDFTQAVTDVDYVVTAIRVGGDEGRVKDERVALSLGALGQETTGAGGFSYAMRTIPVMKDYMRIINQKSKNATVFNFTNPSGLVTQALYLAGHHNTIGICDNATGTKMNLAQALNVDARDLFVRVYGLNHLTWADSITVRGTEIFPQLMANDQFIQNYHDFLYYDRDLMRKLNALPNGYLFYYYHRERALKNILMAKQTRGESVLALNTEMTEKLRAIDVGKNPQQGLQVYFDTMNSRNASYMATELGGKAAVKVPLDVNSLGIDVLNGTKGQMEVLEGYAGVALNYIEAQRHNTKKDLAINVPNNGAIAGLRDDDIVEISCIIDKDGAHPVKVDNVPQDNMLLMQQVKRYERLACDAIDNKSYEMAAMALMANPLVGSFSLAKELLEGYKKAHAEFLTDWK